MNVTITNWFYTISQESSLSSVDVSLFLLQLSEIREEKLKFGHWLGKCNWNSNKTNEPHTGKTGQWHWLAYNQLG
jgi:hypothetical protein